MKPFDTINIQEAVDKIRKHSKEKRFPQCFGVNENFTAHNIITPEVFEQVINTPENDAGRLANILEHIQLTVTNSTEAIFILYMLISFLADHDAKIR